MRLHIGIGLLVAAMLGVGPAGGSPSSGPLLVFASNRAENLLPEIYSVAADGTGRRNVTRDLHSDDLLRISPAGDRIAFVSNRTGLPAVYLARADGSGLRRLTGRLVRAPGFRFIELEWSPRGDRLLASVEWAARYGSAYGLYVVDVRGGRAQRVVAEDFLQAAWSPDGARIAYWAGQTPGTPLDDVVRVIDASGRRLWSAPGAMPLWSSRGLLALSTRPRRGGTRIYDSDGALTARFPGEARQWSPDGSALAVQRGDWLYVVPSDGSGARRLARLHEPNVGQVVPGRFSWSPDGNSIAFSTSARGPELVDLRSGAVRRLPALGPWSADGRRMAFVRYDGPGVGLYVVRVSGPWRPRRIATEPDASGIGSVVWLPDGKRLLYESSRGDNDDELYTLSLKGLGPTALTRNDFDEADPAWSPDGRRIAYSRAEIAGLACKGCARRIYVMRADGKGASRLTQRTRGSEELFDRGPAWSPEGDRIAFTRNGAATPDHVHVIDADGSGLQELARGSDPDWAPDGSKVVFAGPNGGILVMAADGSAVTTLLPARRGFTGASPVWSPDGSRIAFAGSDGLYVMQADGSTPTRILRRRSPSELSWEPDGNRLAFAVGVAGDIYVVGADGRGLTRLTRDPAADSGPDWRPRPTG